MAGPFFPTSRKAPEYQIRILDEDSFPFSATHPTVSCLYTYYLHKLPLQLNCSAGSQGLLMGSPWFSQIPESTAGGGHGSWSLLMQLEFGTAAWQPERVPSASQELSPRINMNASAAPRTMGCWRHAG